MDISSHLDYLFGTEEYVATRRQLVCLREKFLALYFKLYTICSGSLGEGVAYPTSDDDIMFCFPDLRVVQTYREATQRNTFLMVPSEFSPGYCLLMAVCNSVPERLLKTINKMPFLSSTLWKHYMLNIIKHDQIIHGPCLSKTVHKAEYDFAFSISSSFWPDVAQDWVTRNRSNGWPSNGKIQTIVRNGCHVVSIGDPESPLGLHEWRISFSVAERTLMHSFNHVQFLTYNIMRLTLKCIIDKEAPGVFCSYFMKTALFYAIERTCAQFWNVNNIETCFRSSLAVLYDFVNNMNCPSYFIPDYNMMKRKINRRNQPELLNVLTTIHGIGIIGVLHLSGHFKTLNRGSLEVAHVEFKLDGEFLFSYLFTNTIDYLRIPFSRLSFETCLMKLFELADMLMCNSDTALIEIFIHKVINNCCQQMMDVLWNIQTDNKPNYHKHRIIKSLLRLAHWGDATTGKLTTATYMYMVGKTESALYFIRQLLSEYPPFALDSSPNLTKSSAYADFICGKGYSVNFKAKHAWVQDYVLSHFYLNAWPSPLKSMIYILKGVALTPISYAFVIESLCYLRLHMTVSLQRSTQCLINHIDDMWHPYNVMCARLCVGIIKYANGDHQSALRWFGSAYAMKGSFSSPLDERISLSVLTYVACSLERHLN
ncbi:hypothetical protein FSP39_017795 [Pinctada imbricata]|uniref:Mab-21-like HhH/H2TH-like domain-containing protein n=1 Tax=Pinctada imbricata TaxID=66713 RepID=A0AA88Y7B6_PINIB|nr:hypothetical protein FSP39_017795 [Pinctada imbricata]